MRTTGVITPKDRFDHFLARIGWRRNGHQVEPGLYALGSPTRESPVFVTANYTLSFDALRKALSGADAYILVLDTMGINVWCAAGKGTFGTDELVNRITLTELNRKVSHRVLILPQLGAPGICAHEVKRRSGFEVEYGPVRASDLQEYLKHHSATEDMRTVRFDLKDRLEVIPVEITNLLLPALLIALPLLFLKGAGSITGLVAIILSGTVLFPVLLPWLPTRDFSSKGLLLGGMAAVILSFAGMRSDQSLYLFLYNIVTAIFQMAPWVGFLALNFTGSTTFTSRTGVRREIFTYIPVFAAMFILGLVLALAKVTFRTWGVL